MVILLYTISVQKQFSDVRIKCRNKQSEAKTQLPMQRRKSGNHTLACFVVVFKVHYPLCTSDVDVELWCSGPTCLPVTQEIAGSNPVSSAT